MKISLLVPTRGRPESMLRLWASALQTAERPEQLELVFYIDNDDPASLARAESMSGPQVRFVVGPRVVLSRMWNVCCDVATGDVFMHGGDDVIFRSPGWDTAVCRHIENTPDKIAFVYGSDGIQDEKLGTHGFLHANWVHTVGYFVPPHFSCDYNDTWLNEVATLVGRRIYDPSIVIEHMHHSVGKSEYDATYKDARERGVADRVTETWNATAPDRVRDAEKLSDYIKRAAAAESQVVAAAGA